MFDRLSLGLAAALTLLPLSALGEPAVDLPGYDRMEVRSPHRAWPLAASVWYPAGARTYAVPVGDNPIFHGTRAYLGARVAEGRFPLFVFSHGSGGNMDNMSWLLAGLAERGAMVLAVNHPGSTSGDSSPRRSVMLDLRAQDLSAVLDALLADPAFAAHVDGDRITSIGFSLGGGTALNLAGMRLDAGRYAPYCASGDEARADCVFFEKGGVDFRALPAGFAADMRDARITAAVALDPAFTYVATDESVAAMTLPVQIINLGTDVRLSAADASAQGSGFAARLPQVDYVEIAPANHFTALPDCKPMGAAILEEEGEDPICTDPDGADRAAVHARILDEIARFAGL